MYGSIELGGTKIRCAVLDELGNIIKEIRIETSDPMENMKDVVDFLKANPVESIGIGAFGPIDVDKESKTYGFVIETTKKHWRNFDL